MNQASYEYDQGSYYDTPEPYPMTWDRWRLRLDVMIGALLAALVLSVVSALAAVAFFALAANSLEDLEDMPTDDNPLNVTCPDGQVYDPATNSCA